MMEFIDLGRQYRYLKEEIDGNIRDVLEGTDFILGSKVAALEQELAAYVGVRHAITCSDGTAALQLIYMAHGIGAGDAVFCPDMTFIASVEPACMLGATPVFCEIDRDTYDLSPAGLERQVLRVAEEGRLVPRAVVAVDFLGNPADHDALRGIAERYGMLLIEDAAQSMGASYHGRKCGALGDIAATSFFPSKPLGCYGDGGAVFTDDDGTADLIRSLRVHGRGRTKYDNVRIGINSRLDSIQAAVLRPKLRVLDEEIGSRQRIAARYSELLGEKIKVPSVREGCVSSYAQFVLMAESKEQRERIQQELERNGVPTIRYYPTPMHQLPVFRDIERYGEDHGCTRRYAECSFGIPFSPYLSDEEVEKVAGCILNAL